MSGIGTATDWGRVMMYRARHPSSLKADMHFLVIDVRFGTPIYVFLERDPHGQDGYPDLAVQEITLEAGVGVAGRRAAIGRDPAHLERFREFSSDGAVARAGFILVEPRYVGPCWEGYSRHFRPEGDKPVKRSG